MFKPGKQMTADEYLVQWKKNLVWTHLGRPKHRNRLNWCADHCVGNTHVDVGCMLGHSTDHMKSRCPGSWTGIDFTKAGIEEAKTLFPAIEFRFFPDISGLADLEDPGFDTVVCSEVIEHVPYPIALIHYLKMITRKRLIITTPIADAADPSHVRLYDITSLKDSIGGSCEITTSKYFYYAIWDKGK